MKSDASANHAYIEAITVQNATLVLTCDKILQQPSVLKRQASPFCATVVQSCSLGAPGLTSQALGGGDSGGELAVGGLGLVDGAHVEAVGGVGLEVFGAVGELLAPAAVAALEGAVLRDGAGSGLVSGAGLNHVVSEGVDAGRAARRHASTRVSGVLTMIAMLEYYCVVVTAPNRVHWLAGAPRRQGLKNGAAAP